MNRIWYWGLSEVVSLEPYDDAGTCCIIRRGSDGSAFFSARPFKPLVKNEYSLSILINLECWY